MRCIGSGLVLAAVLLGPATANANGRFPASSGVFFSPADPDIVVLRVTFGLLVSRDRGATWDWVCERAVGVSGIEDPMYGAMSDGTFVGSTFQGLIVSPDKACSWNVMGGALDKQVFIDLAVRPNDTKSVVAFASSYDRQDDAGNILFRSVLFESKDNAKTFAPFGAPLDTALLGYTVDVTKSDPDRLYISAVRSAGMAPKGVLLVSKDRGAAWTEYPIALEGTERSLFIAAVDPANADRLYVRTNGGTDKPTRLFLSDDGGKTFRTIFTSQDALLGFSLSPDGSKIYIGSIKEGVLVANTTDFQFQKKSSVQVQCLTATADTLWVCSNEISGFIVGSSKDEGATIEPRLRFTGIRGPMACPEGTSTAQCGADWPALKANLGIGVDAGAAADAGPTAPPPPSDDGGCSVSPRTSSALGAGVMIAAMTLFLRGVMRRRR